MKTTLNKIRRSIAMRGAIGTMLMCAVVVMDRIRPAARRVEAQRQEADTAFDQRWNVETGGIFRPGAGDVPGQNWRYGIRYQAVDANALQETLGGLAIAYPDFTFIDFGSGKGRALLVASGFPFKQIIGVEYCEELNRIARQNLARHPVGEKQCQQITLVHGDATGFPIPDVPLVLFLFNPFGRPVMERVVENVRHSYCSNPRRIIVIYFTPYEAELWSATGVFKRTLDTPAIFDTSAA